MQRTQLMKHFIVLTDWLEASLDAIKTVRPAAEKFYASLSDEQKSALVEHRDHGWRDRGDDAGPDATPPAQRQ